MQNDTSTDVLPSTPELNRWKARLMPGLLLRLTLLVLMVGLGALADVRLASDSPTSSAITADR